MSNNALAVRAAFDTLRTIAQGSLTGSYQAIGTASANAIRLLYIVNDTNSLVTISDDGIHDKFVIGANGFVLYDISSDQSLTQGFYLPVGTIIYVKQGSASTSGSGVYVTIMYGANP